MLKKVLTYSLVVTTIIWSVGLLATPLSVMAASSGDLIKLQCPTGAEVNDPCRAVYYLGADAKRYVFPNEKTYNTWYTDFSGVMTVSSTEMSSYAIGGNVTYRPGTKLVKITTDPKVYAVGADGTLRWVTTGELAESIFGANWASMVEDVPDAFFINYSVGPNIVSASGFDKQAVMDNSKSINEDKGLDGPGSVSTGTSLTVSLASDTPATSVAVEKAARLPFTKVNLTASADGDIVIDSWKVQRAGLATDVVFSSVDILDGATMLPVNRSGETFSSTHLATFSEDFTIPAGTTRSVYLAGNMASDVDLYSGEVPALALAEINLKGNGAVIGSLPITGNYMSVNHSIIIGSSTVQRGAYTNSTNTTLEVGTTGYTVFSFSVQNGSAEESTFSSVRVYQQGSADLDGDLANVKLYEDGTEIATGVVSSNDNNYIDFTFSPITFTKGGTRQFQIKADIVEGSGRTIDLGIYRSTDLLTKGLTYGYQATPGYNGTGSSTTSPVLSDNTFTVSTGTLRVGRSNSVATGNIAIGNDQEVGAFEFEAKGEPITVTALTLTLTSTGASTIEDAARSVKLVDANGNAVAGPTDVTANATTVAFTNTFTVPTGLNVYTVVATLDTNGGWANNDTINASVVPSEITAKGEVTGLTLTPSPGSKVVTTTQTIKAANLQVTKESTPTNKTVIINSTGVLIGSWSFDATDSGEDIRITSLAVRASTTGKLNNLTLKQGSTIINPVNDAPVSVNSANTTSTFTLSEPIIVTKGTSKSISLHTDIGSDGLAGEVDAWGITSNGAVIAYGVDTGNSATVSVTANDGALITIATGGTLAVTEDASSMAGRLVVAGTTGESLSEVRLKSTNEDIDITKLTIRVADGSLTGTAAGSYKDLSKVHVKLNGSVVGNASGYSIDAATRQINLQRGDLTVPQGSTGVKLTITGDLAAVGASSDNLPGTSNADIVVGLSGANGFTAYGNGSNAAATISYTDSTGSAMILHKAVPQVVIETPANSLAATSVISRVKVTAIGGNIGIYRLAFVTTSTTGVNITNAYSKLASCSGSCGGIGTGDQLSATVTAGTDIGAGVKTWSLAVDSTQSHGKRYLAISDGSTAVVDVYSTIGTTANQDLVSTSLLGDTVTTTANNLNGSPATAFTVSNQGNFVWSDLIGDSSQAASSLTSEQWFNGYLVDGLGSTTTSTPITVGE